MPILKNAKRRLRCLVLFVCIAPALIGCGPRIATVKGKVTIKGGQPPEGAMVSFDNATTHIGGSGRVAADGSYKLDSADGKGMRLGEYSAILYPPYAKNSSDPRPAPTFHSKYENAGTSGLKYDVKGGENTFDIELDPPGPPATGS